MMLRNGKGVEILPVLLEKSGEVPAVFVILLLLK
jgi:hypothetical protein